MIGQRRLGSWVASVPCGWWMCAEQTPSRVQERSHGYAPAPGAPTRSPGFGRPSRREPRPEVDGDVSSSFLAEIVHPADHREQPSTDQGRLRTSLPLRLHPFSFYPRCDAHTGFRPPKLGQNSSIAQSARFNLILAELGLLDPCLMSQS